MKIYVCLSPMRKLGLFAPALIVPVVVIASLASDLRDPTLFFGKYWGMLLFGGLMTSYAAIPMVRLCQRVEVRADSIEFVRLFSDVTVHAGSIRKVAPWFLYREAFSIVHREGTVALPSRFTGFSEVIAAIRDQNPAAEIQGC
jgi:hypothetical protein